MPFTYNSAVCFGFEEDLVTVGVGELDDLVFDRGAVARAPRCDRTTVHRRTGDVVTDDLLAGFTEEGNPAIQLFGVPGTVVLASRCRPEVRPRIVEGLHLARLHFERREVDTSAIDAWRSSGLEASYLEPGTFELFGEVQRRAFAGAPAGDPRLGPDMDLSSQESAGGDDDSARSEAATLEGFDADRCAASFVHQESSDRSLHRLDARVLLQERPDGAPVEPAIALCARRPDGSALSAVEHAELEHREIGRSRHDPSQRIDFAGDRPLGDAADGGVAGHLPDAFQCAGDESNGRTGAGGGDGGFGARVTGTDHDDVEVLLMGRHRCSKLTAVVPYSQGAA